MGLDPLLIEVLACPEDKGPLLWFEDEDALYNPRLRRRYAVRDGIPILLVEEAQGVGEDEHRRLVAKAEAEGVPETGHGPPGGGSASQGEGRGGQGTGTGTAGEGG